MIKRPITPIKEFEKAFEDANLSLQEEKLIDFIRYKGIFTQPTLIKELGLKSKPPALTTLCEICRRIGVNMPLHFSKVREWSIQNSDYKIKWDGDLICSPAWNIDGQKLSPENGTSQYHIFVVHKELFQGLE